MYERNTDPTNHITVSISSFTLHYGCVDCRFPKMPMRNPSATHALLIHTPTPFLGPYKHSNSGKSKLLQMLNEHGNKASLNLQALGKAQTIAFYTILGKTRESCKHLACHYLEKAYNFKKFAIIWSKKYAKRN